MRRKPMRAMTWIAVLAILPFAEKVGVALPPGPVPEFASTPQPSPVSSPGTLRSQLSPAVIGADFVAQAAALSSTAPAALPPSQPAVVERVARPKTADWSFWSVTGVLVASTVANAQAYVNCGNCTALPSSFHRSGVLYGVGLPLDVGFACIGYYLKKHDHRWWFAPGAAFAGGNTYLAYHWASRTQ